MLDPLDINTSDFEAIKAWRALPDSGDDSKGELLFLAARRAAVEGKRTNGRVSDHESRIDKLEAWQIRIAAVAGFLVGASPVLLWMLDKLAK